MDRLGVFQCFLVCEPLVKLAHRIHCHQSRLRLGRLFWWQVKAWLNTSCARLTFWVGWEMLMLKMDPPLTQSQNIILKVVNPTKENLPTINYNLSKMFRDLYSLTLKGITA